MKENLIDFTLQKIIREEIVRQRNDLCESGFYRLMHIMHGDVPSVSSIGIFTAENPMGKKLDKEENKLRNQQLEKDLVAANYGFKKIGGKYGNEENPFFVMNMDRDDIIRLGKKYNQESVIYGYKIDNGYEFQYIMDSDVVSRKVFLNLNNPEDFYSEFKGRKFQIPFFDEAYEGAEWDGGRISYKKDELPKDSNMERLVASIQRSSSKLLEENRTKKSKWETRGMININMRKLRKLLGEQ